MRVSAYFFPFLACSTFLLFGAGAQAQTSKGVELKPDQAVLLRSNGRESYQRLKDLSHEQQQDFNKLAEIAYKRLQVAIRRDTSASFAVPQEFSELSCGLYNDSSATTIECNHGLYYCYVSLSSEGDLSAGCGKETPVPATPVDP